MPLIGVTCNRALINARNKAIKAGWLYYKPGAKSVPGKYWVIIPPMYQNMENGPVDESPEEYHTCDTGENTMSKSTGETYHNRTESEPEANTKRTESGNLPTSSSFSTKAEEQHPPDPAPETAPAAAKKPAKFDPRTVPIPPELDHPEFRDIWAIWITVRTAKGAKGKITHEHTVHAQFKKLVPLGPVLAAACVNDSIANGWQGLFPDKFKPGANGRAPTHAERQESHMNRSLEILFEREPEEAVETAPQIETTPRTATVIQ